MLNKLILRFISDCLKIDDFFIYDIRQLQKLYPKLTQCYYDSIVNGVHKYSLLYNSFMTLMSSRKIDDKLFDKVHNCWISNDIASNWKHLILTTFYYFKTFFPAALIFYKSPLYDTYVRDARSLILKSYAGIYSKCDLIPQYDLCEMWDLKIKLLKRQVTWKKFYPYNIINNVKLIKRPTPSLIKRHVNKVSFNVIKRLVDTYKAYSYVVHNRRFLICKEKSANSKYANIFKLRFMAHNRAQEYIDCIKIEQNTNLYFLFKNENDLLALVTLYNNSDNATEQISIPKRRTSLKQPYKSVDNFFKCVNTIYRRKVENICNLAEDRIYTDRLKANLEEQGFTSLYSLKDSNTLAYVKNRVVHLSASFKCPLFRNAFHEKKGKPLVKIEKMIRTMTISRYKTDTLNDNEVSFNINFQGPINVLQLILSRFLNENKHLGCRFTSKVWVSNVCTTSDTVHTGILNPHVYREKCLKNNHHMSYPMLNFPAMMTLINDHGKENVSSVINNRTSINTCRLFGADLITTLKKHSELISQTCEIDFDLIKVFYRIETIVKELLPKNIVLLIHLLYLHKDVEGYTDDDIVNFFDKNMLCSRMMTSSNRSFSTFNLYAKKYKSDAVDNVSIKSVKYFDISPPLVSRDKMYKMYTLKFRDVGCLNKVMCQPRGRNATLIDLILNSKDLFFRSERCQNILQLLKDKYWNRPIIQDVISLFFNFLNTSNDSDQ